MRIKIGDKLPNSELFYLDQNNDVKKIDILDLCKGKTIILGMPGAFTKTCSALHLPGYIKNYELANKKGISKIVCVAVNDPNVMKAWGDANDVGEKIDMLADPHLSLIKALGLDRDMGSILGVRAARCALIIDDGVVTKMLMEDVGAFEVSSASYVLGEL